MRCKRPASTIGAWGDEPAGERRERRMSRKAIVTGGAGFIGSHLVDLLVDRGWDLLVVDDLSTGKREFLPGGAEFIDFSHLIKLSNILMSQNQTKAVFSCFR